MAKQASTRQVQDAYIVAATRTPVGKAPRALATGVRVAATM